MMSECANKTKKMANDLADYKGLDAVAIVGFAGSFPGAPDADAFWRNLLEGVESISVLTDDELAASGASRASLEHPQYVKAGAFLEGVEMFDAGFFGYNPREATYSDPQQRHLLECAWAAFEHAGYDVERYDEPVGVYVSGAMSTYLVHMVERDSASAPLDRFAALLGNDKDSLPTKISYALNLKGPCYSIQSHCSSSLVAVHVACQGLLDGECKMALAGGITIRVPHRVGYFYQPGSINSPDGHCRPFDANAQGTVFGNGMGLVALKRLEDALADRDAIYAVIRGSAVNNDGGVKAGYTAPSVEGQAAVVREAMAAAGVEPSDIDYVEAHGTGTALGDPTEMAALKKAFAESQRATPHLVGSCKSNIGHLDTASGVAGLIKLTQMLRHKRLPPTLHFKTPNPEIDFFNSPFRVVAEGRPWESAAGRKRFGSVSSFGVGGTNAHAVLMEGPEAPTEETDRRHRLIPVSARSEAALARACDRLVDAARRAPLRLADVAFTLQQGRKAFPYRKFAVVDRLEDLAQAFGEGGESAVGGKCDGAVPQVVFMFPGQGSQRVGMGRSLYESEPVFRESLDRSRTILQGEGIDLFSCLYPENGGSKADEALASTAIAQPALFAIEHAMAELWMSWGVKPAACIGHSIGELVGASLAGVMSMEDALRLVAYRGKAMNECERGAMVAVELPAEELEALAGGKVVVAARNGPSSTVLSGSFESVEAFSAELERAGASFKPVRTSHAFHSPMMDEAARAFERRVKKVALSTPRIPVYSNVSGRALSDEEATDPAYWGRQLRERVLFGQDVESAIGDGRRLFLEVGPGQGLSSLARRQASFDGSCRAIASMPHPKAVATSEAAYVLESLGRLWAAGAAVDWSAVGGAQDARRVALPTYPFERARYWYEGSGSGLAAAAPGGGKRKEIGDWLYAPTWRQWRSFDGLRSEPQAEGRWLVLLDELGVGETFARFVEDRGGAVTRFRHGSAFEQVAEREFTVDGLSSEGMRQALGAAKPSAGFDRIAHFWNVGAAGGGRLSGFDGLFPLAQQLARQGGKDPLKLCVFADRLFDALEGEELEPRKSGALGVTRVLPKECRTISCHAVDIGWSEGDPVDDRLLQRMLRVCAIDDRGQGYPALAFRQGAVWVEEFESLAEVVGAPANLTQLAEAGECVLVAGGLGGVGLALAQAIASEAGANVALLSRRGLPERGRWGGADLTGEERAQVEAVQAIERIGVKVMALAADVADVAGLQQAVATFEQALGPIRSVVHAAGAAGGGMIALRKPEEFERVLRAKVAGMEALQRVLDFGKLRRVVLCSSLSSYLAEYAQSDYCAGNCVLDAWARRLRSEGVPAVSINWDVWAEAGMSVVAGEPGNVVDELRLENARGFGMSHSEGVEALRRALAQGLPQVLVSTRRLSEWKDQSQAIEARLKAAASAREEQLTQLHERPRCSVSYAPPSSAIEVSVARIWQVLLGIREIGRNDDFLELGGHSLLATQALNRISQDYPGVELSLADLFTNPTVKGIAAVIEARLADEQASRKPLYEELSGNDEAEIAYRIGEYSKTLWTSLRDDGAKGVSDAIWQLKRDLKLVIYPDEISKLADAGRLAELLSVEFSRQRNPHWVKAATFQTTLAACLPICPAETRAWETKNARAVFLHSAPRSGSTLLRLLLAGHPDLFSPPELGLLMGRSMSEWKSRLLSSFSAEGLVAALAELQGGDAEAARTALDDLVRRDVAVKDVYALLQEGARGRMLVDKTPLYGLSIEALRRAECYFDQPRYIHLVRHPFAVIDSFVRKRFDRIFTQEAVDPYRFGEDMWAECETNLAAFFREIGPERVFRLKFEDLVADVDGSMRALADFLEIDFHPDMVDPYLGDRIASGLGDPDVLNHSRVEPELAERWRSVRLPQPMRSRSREIATAHGYPLSALARASEEIDDLSEEELDRLLAKLESQPETL